MVPSRLNSGRLLIFFVGVMAEAPTISQEKRLENSIGDDGIGALAAELPCHERGAPHPGSVPIDASAADALSLYKFCFMRSQFA